LQRVSQSAMFVPILAAGVLGEGSGSLAALHALFYLYIVTRGGVAHREYWESVHTTELLRRHAASAQLAAAAAAEANRQLRAEIAHSAKMEVELRQAQKLEAIGRLAAGIAHEINTPLQFIADSCEFIVDGAHDLGAAVDDYRRIVGDLAGGRLAVSDAVSQAARVDDARDLAYLRDQIPSSAALALQGLERVSKIVAATKDYVYLGEKTHTDVNQAIERTILLSNNETRYVADVETELGELPSILCHTGELNQAVLNLIINAADAIGDTGARGTIHIKTWADPGWVRISVRDTGTGIPAEIIDKIYEPFFTTKPVGKGTGQGLATAHTAIVNKHGGTIDVRSQLGAGTTFTISLPAA
jgi:signal transduction histidine kinase